MTGERPDFGQRFCKDTNEFHHEHYYIVSNVKKKKLEKKKKKQMTALDKCY